MTTNDKNILKGLFEQLSKMDYIKPEDIPGIPLYMDQVTTFMENQLESSRRHPDDKILTKTMINNYAKNDLIPPPDKKKYSREHLLLLIFIYYFKNILSISDIQTLLQPITDKYFASNQKLDLTAVYKEVFSLEKGQIDCVIKDIIRSYRIAESTFADAPEKEQEFLHQFTFICMLSFDVYVKKQIIENMIDQMAENKEKTSAAKTSSAEKSTSGKQKK